MESVANISKKIMIDNPFYGLFLCGLNKRFDKVGTACVGLEGINTCLRIDKDYWDKQDENGRIFLILHELGHICLMHIIEHESWKAYCPEHYLLNLGMDMAVNTLMDHKYWTADSAACELFRQFPNLPQGKGTKFYIEFLRKLDAKVNGKNSKQQKGQGQGQGQNQGQNQGQGQSQGQGSGDSQEAYDKQAIAQSVGQYDGKTQKDKQIIKQILENNEDTHGSWSQLDELSDSEKEMVKSQIEYQMKETAASTSKGDWPGGLVETLTKLFTPKPALFDWKQAFRRILGTAFDVNRKLTRRKESKRFEDAMGSKLKKKHKILVGIDTSGSVATKDFYDFFSEIYHVHKEGGFVHVLECDTEITNEYDYNGKMPEKMTGRGGTILQPMYEYYEKHRKDYTLFIVFTDGYCDLPEKPLPNTMWIITSGGYHDQKYPGYTLHIK